MEKLDELIGFLSAVKIQQKLLLESEAETKAEILKIMRSNKIKKEDTEYGTVRIQKRNEKQYSDGIKQAEERLKEDKKLADDLGDYEIVSTKESLVFTLQKPED